MKNDKVTVYFFEKFDIVAGENVRCGPATLEAIAKVKCVPLKGTSLEIEESELDGNRHRHGLRTAVDASASVVLSR